MSTKGKGDDVAVSFVGKAKTTAQMIALLFLIYENDLFGLPSFTIGVVLLVGAAFLTLYSLAVYFNAAWKTIRNSG